MPSLFERLHKIFMAIEGKMKSESFKVKIMACIRAWTDWTIYPNDFLVNLQNTFLGLTKTVASSLPSDESAAGATSGGQRQRDNGTTQDDDNEDEDVDGRPLDDENDHNDHDDDDSDNNSDENENENENGSRSRIEKYSENSSSSIDGVPCRLSRQSIFFTVYMFI